MAETVAGMFLDVVGRHGGRPAFRHRTGETIVTYTYRELADRVEALGTALLALGVRRGERVGLISDNRPEWIVADLACIGIGAPDVPRGSDTTPREIEYILGHSGASATFVEDERRLGAVLAMRERLPGLKLVVVLDPGFAGELPCDVHRLEDLQVKALKVLGVLMTAFCGIGALLTGRDIYVDVAIAWAVQAFIGNLAFAKYLEGRPPDD